MASALAAVVVGGTAWSVAVRGARDDRATIAVLPLLSTGGDSAQHILAEGFSDELATALVGVPWIRVVSRQGVNNYSGKADIDPRAAGRALGARYVVMGAFHELEGRRTITARLVSTTDASVVWAGRFDRSVDLEALGGRIVTTIGDRLRPRTGRYAGLGTGARPARRHADDDAYLLYLVGKRELTQRNQDLAGSIAHFRQAIALDTLWAEPRSALSLAIALSPNYRGASADSVAPIAIANARRALALDPTLAEPHVALGLVLARRFQWDAAEAELKTAVDMDPHNVEARLQYGRLLIYRNRLADGLRELQKARADDPASAVVLSWLSFTWYLRGQLDSAQVASARAMESNPANLTTVCFRAMILAALGRNQEARQRLAGFPPFNPMGLYALAAAGDTQTVRTRLDAITNGSAKTPTPQTGRAFALLGLGDTAQALSALERATAAREIWPAMHPASSRVFDGVRESARFQALLARVGLAERR